MTVIRTTQVSPTTEKGFSVLGRAKQLNAGVHKAYIDGQWVEPGGGEVWQHRHPASGEPDFTIARSSASDVDRAVRAARRAFDEGPWRQMRARERKLILRPIGDLVRAAEKELAELQSLDNGLPIAIGSGFRFSGSFAADLFEYHIGWIDKLDGSVPPVFSSHADAQMLTLREPVGVVAAVTPFNAPVMQFAQKVAPALAAGCTVVFKPSEYASNVAALFVRLIEQLDLPPGVINLVPGDASTSAALFNHPLIDKIAFTGRREVGEIILRAAAPGIKRVQLELGGKSPSIVFDDVEDISATARYAMSLVSMGLSGQLCSTQTRALVHRSVYSEFIAAATEQLADVRIGDSFDAAVTSAPLVNAAAADRVERLIQGALQEGARHVAGGDRVTELPGGNWITPTILADVSPSMTIARTEVFGPVLSVIPFDDEEDAIRIANDSEYGLSAGVYTRNPTRAIRVARALRTGTVGINSLFVYPPPAPFGGYKTSGLGREGGRQGFEDYLETKTISIPLG
ncbi:aldehyde dehydrogenase [Variovorax sp. WS11]|uniref:aldehyde dehydrogenase family protein n=1 Tax=Variovorax sp. WS11 TaxID=1105204 RepID=UPI000D0CE0A5|nr:aldehyde dehydrogenase family protein [Variovorax sp. WS11]NDZ17566.1 aldehyde dehydrogenase [Variovorax sp. WS11]PSL82229.1 aldehyde dehydrogenase [Variovorax sp. WS11]